MLRDFVKETMEVASEHGKTRSETIAYIGKVGALKAGECACNVAAAGACIYSLVYMVPVFLGGAVINGCDGLGRIIKDELEDTKDAWNGYQER